MAKKKSQKKASSSQDNPFNVKVNRIKFSVLNQKVKGTRGLPGISHSVCNTRRKEEFHKKRIQSQKANKFVDKRFMDASLSHEEQATLRMVEERKKKFKKNIFNLNDEESLTHKGIPLENHKSLSDTVHDSDDEEQLDPKFVKYAHFGGFSNDPSSETKSRKEIIDELIVESKKRKMERKMEKEENDELVEKLDQEWKAMHHQLLPIMRSKKPKIEPAKNDAFDVLLNELKFETKTAAPVPVKSPEEIALEESKKLRQLEEERNERMMNPIDCAKSKDNLLSADSLYDGLDIQFEPIDEQENGNVNIKANENSEDDESGEESSNDSEDEIEMNDEIKDYIEIPSLVADADSDFPDTIEKFSTFIENHSEELHAIVENIIKNKIKNKSKKNVEQLELFFAVLIEYIMNLNDNIKGTFEILDDILPHLYTLAEVSTANTAVKLLKFLDEEQEIFQSSKGKKMRRNFPRSQTLVLFKIISALYSVSDFKHPVVTPAIVFMCDVLSSAYCATFQNMYTRLCTSKIMYDCVSFSKRYVPEVIWFLNKTLELALNSNKKFNLYIDQEVNEERVQLYFKKSDKSCSSNVKASIIAEVTELFHKFAVLYEPFQYYTEIFGTSLDIITKMLMIDNFVMYPQFLRDAISNFVTVAEGRKQAHKPLVFENKKPVPLKLFEPAFECKFTKKKDDIRKKRKLVISVNQKIRKEEKGLLREMRRDNQVIASEKLKEQLEADEERKRKVKELYRDLSMQEGEYKKYVKKK